MILVAVALFIFGIMGYRLIVELNWIDSLYNTSLAMTTLGQVSEITTSRGKIFVSIFAFLSVAYFFVAIGTITSLLAATWWKCE